MVSVHAGTLLLGEDRTVSKRLVTAAAGFFVLTSVTGLIGHTVVPELRFVAAFGSLACAAVFALVATVAAYRNQGLAVCWTLAFPPLYGAAFNGMVGITGAYPTLGEWFVLGVRFGAGGGLLVGTAAFLVGFAARLVSDWYGGRDAQPA